MDEFETGVERTRSEITSPHQGLTFQLDRDGGVSVELGDERVRVAWADPIRCTGRRQSDWSEWHTESTRRVESELVRWTEASTAVGRTVSIEQPESGPVGVQ